ncbi:MAG TPA: glutamine synthetase GlnII [Polyangiales bacterium]
MAIKAEYIWVDGTEPTKQLRSKTKILPGPVKDLKQIPDWGFDGSSTNQAEGHASDCIMKPVFFCPDPLRGGDNILVMTEVFSADGKPHPTNTRAPLRAVAEKYASEECMFGMEQEYTMLAPDGRPLGFPEGGFPLPQGPYYCSVGANVAFGRPIVEAHMDACLAAGLKFAGINAEVMPGQWEFQIGVASTLEVGDHLHLARWLLSRIAEEEGVTITLDAKPMRGDWNGTGCHTNYSTKAMRADGGIKAILAACEKFRPRAELHVANYGAGIEQRLTGKHETASYKQFSFGVGNRGASLRIPLHCEQQGKGYLEDRRPNANCDPYVVARLIVETTCG